jgi:hypothetical protein
MDWYHMVSDDSTERFVFRVRGGPLCASDRQNGVEGWGWNRSL